MELSFRRSLLRGAGREPGRAVRNDIQQNAIAILVVGHALVRFGAGAAAVLLYFDHLGKAHAVGRRVRRALTTCRAFLCATSAHHQQWHACEIQTHRQTCSLAMGIFRFGRDSACIFREVSVEPRATIITRLLCRSPHSSSVQSSCSSLPAVQSYGDSALPIAASSTTNDRIK